MTRFWLQIGLVGLGAGACSALLFASMLSGSIISVGLFYLSPLPILIVALGWSHWAGLAAALAAALGLTFAFGPFYFLAFLICIGVPAWWLGYLAMLARPAGPADELEWYPPGRLVVWGAVLGALMTLVALSQLGSDKATIQSTLHEAIERMLRAQTQIPADKPLVLGGLSDAGAFIDILVAVMPPAAAALTTVTQLFNLWLAARVVRISGRLKRPWPDLAAMRFPLSTPVALAAATAGSFLPGTAGVAAALPAASLLVAYAALGFAVLHGITRHLPSRGVVLFGTYAAVAVFGWPILLMTLLGLIDTALDLRRRVAAMRGPPAPLA
jgi:hypothetical protein